ncbi:hypothetical protein [Chelatococcus sp. XZ-Ab1]|uniref:hypothetical protein n=1 Tax=Chelatococcus sp. XZ-Ab1 TaxID=3034027 RepID=UPI0023E3F190|nr:hypothetical protein [Chelatococcus sp. XZ-Ab1]
MTDIDTKELRRLMEEATAGPVKWWTSNSWRRLRRDDRGIAQSIAEPYVARDGHPDLDIKQADMDFIAALWNSAPALLSEAEEAARLREELAALRAAPTAEPMASPRCPMHGSPDSLPAECPSCGRALHTGCGLFDGEIPLAAPPVAGHDMKSPFMFDGPIHRVSAKTMPPLGREMPTASLAEGELPSFSDDIDMAWTELCLTKRDHTSPTEYPDMRLITRDELAEFMSRRMPPAPAAEPVMWRFRFLSNGEPGGWYFTMEPPRETGNRSAEYQALYTAPPVANGRRDRYRRAAEFAAKMAWREDPPNAHQKLTDSERLSAIKYHPDIKALAVAPTEAGRDE